MDPLRAFAWGVLVLACVSTLAFLIPREAIDWADAHAGSAAWAQAIFTAAAICATGWLVRREYRQERTARMRAISAVFVLATRAIEHAYEAAMAADDAKLDAAAYVEVMEQSRQLRRILRLLDSVPMLEIRSRTAVQLLFDLEDQLTTAVEEAELASKDRRFGHSLARSVAALKSARNTAVALSAHLDRHIAGRPARR